MPSAANAVSEQSQIRTFGDESVMRSLDLMIVVIGELRRGEGYIKI